MLTRPDWWTECPRRHFSRWSFRWETVWVILQVLTMGRIGMIRMMERQCMASWAKIMNPAGWWAESPKRYSSAWRSFRSSRWRLTNWDNRDGRMQPTTQVTEIRSTAHPDSGFQQWLNRNRWWCIGTCSDIIWRAYGVSWHFPRNIAYATRDFPT